MIKQGSFVFVRPSKSIRFAGRWAELIEVDMTKPLPFLLKFQGDGMEYGFGGDEIMSAATYYSWFNIGDLVEFTTGERKNICCLDFPTVYFNDNSYCHFSEILLVHACTKCNELKAGIFKQECEDCLDGGFTDGQN